MRFLIAASYSSWLAAKFSMKGVRQELGSFINSGEVGGRFFGCLEHLGNLRGEGGGILMRMR